MAEWATVVTAFLTLIYVGATIVYVIFTFRIASATKKASEVSEEAVKISQKATEISSRQLEKVAELEENRVRPYVLFNIVSDERHITLASLKNYGLTAAYEVKVKITPDLHRAFGRENDPSIVTSESFSFLPPNFDIDDSLGGSPEFYQRYKEPTFEGTVSYKDSKGNDYEESFRINLKSTSKRLWVSEREIWKCFEDLNKNLDKMNSSIEKIVKQSPSKD